MDISAKKFGFRETEFGNHARSLSKSLFTGSKQRGDVDVSMMQVSVSCPPPFLRCFVGTRVAQSTVNDKSNTLHYPFALTLHSNRFVRKCLLRGKDKPGQSSGRKREEEEQKKKKESGKVESHASVIIIFRNISRI